MKQKLTILLIIAVLLSCKKLDFNREDKVTQAKDLSASTNIVVESQIIDMSEDIISYGHCWNTIGEATINDFHTNKGASINRISFSDTLVNLKANEIYFVRSYIKTINSVTYGDELQIQTPINGISFANLNYNFVEESSFEITSSINNIGSLSVSEYGFCFKKNSAPTVSDSVFNNGITNVDIEFSASVTNLNIGQNYYIRPYAKLNENIYIYGDTVRIFIPDLRVITKGNIITGSYSVRLLGEISQLGILDISSHGFCWSYLTSNPNLNNSSIDLGNIDTERDFEYPLSGLENGLDYYYRAYAIENGEVTYGEVLNFKID